MAHEWKSTEGHDEAQINSNEFDDGWDGDVDG